MRPKMWCFAVNFIASRNVANVLSLAIGMTFTFGTIWACASDTFQTWLHHTIIRHIHRCGGCGLSLWNGRHRCYRLICNRRCSGHCCLWLWCWWCQCVCRHIAYDPFLLWLLFDMLHRLRCQCYCLRYWLCLWCLLMLLNGLLRLLKLISKDFNLLLKNFCNFF